MIKFANKKTNTIENKTEIEENLKYFKNKIKMYEELIRRIKESNITGEKFYDYENDEMDMEDLEIEIGCLNKNIEDIEYYIRERERELEQVQLGIVEKEERDLKGIFECGSCGELEKLTEHEQCIYDTFPNSKCSRCEHYADFHAEQMNNMY